MLYEEWPTLVVRVDRSSLTDGTYVGHIDITSDGGDLSIPVSLQVQREVLAADVGTVYVLAVDPQTYENLGQARTTVRDRYSYELPPLSAREYLVAAGTDRDNDNLICDPGEACGIWPLMDSPSIINLDGDRRADFPVSIDLFARVSSQSMSSDKLPTQGFPIRRDKRIQTEAEPIEHAE